VVLKHRNESQSKKILFPYKQGYSKPNFKDVNDHNISSGLPKNSSIAKKLLHLRFLPWRWWYI